mmetsp:Transcript_17501/g.25735  ORF Transcript_17501/g.25735 Transcript_17501/m.25735 type:complete len:112 (+) Transcript_17501:1487-1822(+)
MGRNRNNGTANLLTQILLRCQSQLCQNHSADLFGTELLLFIITPINHDLGLTSSTILNGEWKALGFFGHDFIGETAAYDTLYVVDCVACVRRCLRFGGLAYHFAVGGEGYP